MAGRGVLGRRCRLLLGPCTAVAFALTTVVALPSTAYASSPSGNVNCPAVGACTVTVAGVGSHTPTIVSVTVATAAASPSCSYQRHTYPCSDPVFGWFDSSNGCYYAVATRPSGPGDPVNLSVGAYHPPGDGTYYDATCMGPGAGTMGGYTWLPNPPRGAPAPPAPAVLAQRALRLLDLGGPRIRTSPPGEQLVGVPMWVWTTVGPTTWSTHSVTAAVPGESVTATASAQQITWTFGDGASVVCAGPGTPYAARDDPAAASPSCGHTYTTSSVGEPADAYLLTATTTWQVAWSGGGTGGRLTVTRASRVTVRVAEAQALTVARAESR